MAFSGTDLVLILAGPALAASVALVVLLRARREARRAAAAKRPAAQPAAGAVPVGAVARAASTRPAP